MISPQLMLKVIVILHFGLSTWGDMSVLMPLSYIYVHIGVFACGLSAVALPESTDAIIMMMATLGFSVIQDIILLSLYVPRAHEHYEPFLPEDELNEYGFALRTCIVNLVFKPFTLFILFRLFKSRNGGTEFSILGNPRSPGTGDMGNNRGYGTGSNSGPASNSGVPAESANPHSAQ